MKYVLRFTKINKMKYICSFNSQYIFYFFSSDVTFLVAVNMLLHAIIKEYIMKTFVNSLVLLFLYYFLLMEILSLINLVNYNLRGKM